MRIGVGLSGGIDSATSALLLLKEGHEVAGYTMLLADGGEQAAEKAARIAGLLGIRHRVLDFREAFEECILE